MSENPCDQPWYDIVVIPALLRHARKAYGAAMRAALADIDCDDIPNNGMYIIGGLAMETGSVPLSQLIKELGVCKEAAGQLVDTLVLRGYLDRSADAEDMRKVSITLSRRGHAAAAVQTAARKSVDTELAARVGPECVAQMRKALGALCSMGHPESDHEHDC